MKPLIWCVVGLFAVYNIYIIVRNGQTAGRKHEGDHCEVDAYQSSKQNYKMYKLLIASSVSSVDMAAYVHSMRSYLGTDVKFILNCHAENTSRQYLEVYLHEQGVSDLVLFITVLPGAKALFWKTFLIPSLVADFDILWLLDTDMLFDLDHFPLRRFLGIAMTTRALIFQPSVIGEEAHKELRAIPTADGSVARATCFVESMTAFIRSDMWRQVHSRGLIYIEDNVLRQSSWGIDYWWSDMAATQHLMNSTKNSTIHIGTPPCVIVQATPIVHLNTRTMPRSNSNRAEPRLIGIKTWNAHSRSMNITDNCKHLSKSLGVQQQKLFFLNEKTMIPIALGSTHQSKHNKLIVKQVKSDWQANAARIYNLNRQQDVQMVRNLNTKWKNKILIGNGSSWEYLQLLKNVTDPTDNSLLNMSQWTHVLQVYTAMKADKVSSPKALFLALAHDFGKLLALFGEDDSNIMCSTIMLQPGELGGGIDRAVITWNHDEFGFIKLSEYLPRDIAWVIRYHSLSALLKGELDQFLTHEEHTWFPLLRLLWKYDHLYKDAMHIPVVDLKEARAIFELFLPPIIRL